MYPNRVFRSVEPRGVGVRSSYVPRLPALHLLTVGDSQLSTIQIWTENHLTLYMC